MTPYHARFVEPFEEVGAKGDLESVVGRGHPFDGSGGRPHACQAGHDRQRGMGEQPERGARGADRAHPWGQRCGQRGG